MNEIVLTAEHLTKSYKYGSRHVTALDDVSISIKPGKLTAVVGPSGAGKSTLLHILGGLDKPTSGKVITGGRDIYKLSDSERSRVRNSSIGFVFQSYHLLPEFTALENVMMPALMMKRSPAEAKAEDVLKAVGLEHRLLHKPGELSGGESQRVAIARALVNSPQILLCDEPTGNLDSKTSESIYELLSGLRDTLKTAVVIVTHDEGISNRADEVIRIKDGCIL